MDNRGNEFSSATWVYRRFKRKDFPRTLTKPLQRFLSAGHVKIANHKKTPAFNQRVTQKITINSIFPTIIKNGSTTPTSRYQELLVLTSKNGLF